MKKDLNIRRVAAGRIGSFYETVVFHDMCDELRGLMGALNEREALVIRARYALSGGAPATYAAIGKTLGISAVRVRQIAEKALIKMRPSDPKRLPSFFRGRTW